MATCQRYFCSREPIGGCNKCKWDFHACAKHFEMTFRDRKGNYRCPMCYQPVENGAQQGKQAVEKRVYNHRCWALTQSGNQCQRTPKANGYCHQHANYTTNKPSKTTPETPGVKTTPCRVCGSTVHLRSNASRAARGAGGFVGGSVVGAVLGTIAFPGFGTLAGLIGGGMAASDSIKQVPDVCTNCCGVCNRSSCICAQIVGMCVRCRKVKVTVSQKGICDRCKYADDV